MEPADGFPIQFEPPPAHRLPVLVTIPHFGTATLPGIDPSCWREERFRTFPCGYSDPFAAEIYGGLHRHGATVVATPYSRLFVDVNRARDDFDVRDGAARSHRGVVRTHIRGDEPLFRSSLCPDSVERRLARFYDPYHARVTQRLDALRERFGGVVLIDGHTASLDGHELVLGTRRGATCSAAVIGRAEALARRHGFEPSFDVSGYAGGHTVRRHGSPDGPVQALQLEFNAARIMRTTRRDYARARSRGESPPHDAHWLARCAAYMGELVTALGELPRGRRAAGG